jgi:hypothetical protein
MVDEERAKGHSIGVSRVASYVLAGVLSVGCAAGTGATGDFSNEAPPDIGDFGKTDSARNYVLTPAGFFHESCVHDLGEDATLEDDGTVVLADGTSFLPTPCRYRSRRVRSAFHTPDANGWVESSNWTSPTYVTALSADWVVPPEPTSAAGELIYFFPSVEPPQGDRILQPVLQFGSSPAGGGNYWALASWYVDDYGNASHTSVLKVAAGDHLTGTMTTTSCTADGGCHWTVVSRDTTSNKSRRLRITRPEAYTLVNGGVLEAYSVANCRQLPAGGMAQFGNIVVTGAGGAAETPTWMPMTYSQALTGCRFNVVATGNQTQLFY